MNFYGRLGSDATLKTFDSGASVVNFDVAVNTPVKENGEWKDQTTWVSCAKFFGKDSNTTISKYLKKGVLVIIKGSPNARAYINKEGEPVAVLGCKVDKLSFFETADKPTASRREEPSSKPEPTPQHSQEAEDDLPF